VRGIPTFILLDAKDLSVANRSARGPVEAGQPFPWLPKAVNELEVSTEGINDRPSLVALMEKAEGVPPH